MHDGTLENRWKPCVGSINLRRSVSGHRIRTWECCYKAHKGCHEWCFLGQPSAGFVSRDCHLLSHLCCCLGRLSKSSHTLLLWSQSLIYCISWRASGKDKCLFCMLSLSVSHKPSPCICTRPLAMALEIASNLPRHTVISRYDWR